MRWRYFWLALVFAWFVIREILDGVGRIQAAKEIFVHRGKLMALLGDFLTWRWSPVVSFAVLVLAFACITYLPDCIAAISGSAKSSIQATSTGDKVPTVHDMYLRDFQSLNSINKEIEYRSTDGSQSVKIEFNIRLDVNTGSKFVTVYVPDSPLTYDFCKDLPRNRHAYSASEIKSWKYRAPSDDELHELRDLVDTKRVFVYYDGIMNHQQLGTLEGVFQNANLTVIFRGQSYAYSRWMEEKAMPKKR